MDSYNTNKDFMPILRKYNYNLKTGTVGTDDDNLANILYSINRMEMNEDFESDDEEEIIEELSELHFYLSDAKVHFNNFTEAFGNKLNTDTIAVVINALDKAMIETGAAVKTLSANPEKADLSELSALFPKIFNKMLEIVPAILNLDNQAVGRI